MQSLLCSNLRQSRSSRFLRICICLSRLNPGTVTDFELDDDGRFKFCFFSYGACIHGFFRSSIRPIIAIDGTHLKGRFHGILFMVACSDGNKQVYPLAFRISHKENRESWTWFLRRVRKCFDCLTDCMFISDQHKGIKKAMRIVYPDAPHGLCVFHLTMNLKNTFKREDVIGIFKRTYQIYRESEFNEEMSELMRVHLNAYNDLMTIGPARWSRAYSHVRRYFMMTSNIAECINSCSDMHTVPYYCFDRVHT
ncbi:hypothetical protein Dsin_009457 [Dipteronia sinensis]|uniref:MULE transposase domain-containing protein n=1 Tax=Dipteronia sinensis TaxID=43782 RepID=A0AAE0ARV3_9ROSI|nr:hypothetical protein Dsin_009457 [Dipteronia sinensis]